MTILRKAGMQQTPWIAFIFAWFTTQSLRIQSGSRPLLGPIRLQAAHGRIVMLKTGRLVCSG